MSTGRKIKSSLIAKPKLKKNNGANEMDLLLWMLFGSITAWIASIIMGYKSRAQCVAAGIVGAIAAGMAMQALTGKPETGINYFSLIVSVAGSLLLAVLTMFIGTHEHNKR